MVVKEVGRSVINPLNVEVEGLSLRAAPDIEYALLANTDCFVVWLPQVGLVGFGEALP